MTMAHARLRLAPFVAVLLTVALVALGAVQARAAVKIQEVVSPGGITAWLVEDYSVPIISVRFAFKGGTTQDPEGKEGLVNLMTGLFDEGAGDLDSDAFQLALDDAGAEMSFSAGTDAIFGAMRMLSDRGDDAFPLLRMAVASPRFESAPMIRIREQILAGIQARSLDPSARSEVAWREAIYPGHPYARSDEGTAMSLASIATEDLAAAHRALFARSNLVVGVVGAIDAETLKTRLDEVFGGLPEEPSLKPIDETEPRLDQQIRVEYDLPQATIQIAWPGVSRDDPAFFAAYLMNHIFGGGTFSSRLFDEIREKRGLAYGVDSSLYTRDYSNALVVSTATRSDRAAETLSIIREEARRMAQDGPTEAELEFAKRYVKGVYAIANLGSSAAIAGTLVNLQSDGLGIDYIERRQDLIDAVTLDEVKAAAQRLLVDEPAVMIVGPPQAGETQP